jgi:3-methyladenine DNA glycosylase Mpg
VRTDAGYVRAAVIIDVEASRAIRQAAVGAAGTMIERTANHFGLRPQRIAGDTAYGSAEMLNVACTNVPATLPAPWRAY